MTCRRKYTTPKTINTILSPRDCDIRRTITNFLFGPDHYQIGLLPNIEELKQKAKDYINVLKTSTLHGTDEIIDMTESLIKHYEKELSSDKKRIASEMFFKMTNALDDMRGQSFEKMLPLTYDAMHNRKEGVK